MENLTLKFSMFSCKAKSTNVWLIFSELFQIQKYQDVWLISPDCQLFILLYSCDLLIHSISRYQTMRKTLLQINSSRLDLYCLPEQHLVLPPPHPTAAAATASTFTGLSPSTLVRSLIFSFIIFFKESKYKLDPMSGAELSQQQELKTTYTLTWPTFDLNVLKNFSVNSKL